MLVSIQVMNEETNEIQEFAFHSTYSDLDITNSASDLRILGNEIAAAVNDKSKQFDWRAIKEANPFIRGAYPVSKRNDKISQRRNENGQ